MTLAESLPHLIQGYSLKERDAFDAMSEIVSGRALPSRTAAFLTALAVKGETPEEIAGCARSLRHSCTPVKVKARTIIDTCGTGGDGRKSFNISTAAAFVVAGAGFVVAKHGNRSISSRCGSADVLEILGVNPEMPPALAEKAINEIGIAFLFAPRYHPAMRHAMPVRRELGFRTIFNLLGPLANPAHANAQLIGVPEERLVSDLARALVRLGEKRGIVVHTEGWDEITLTGPSHVARIKGGMVRMLRLSARDFGLARVHPRDLAGGDAHQNAKLIFSILGGRQTPQRRVVVANAACAIWMAADRPGQKISLTQAVKTAERAIDSGAALAKLKALARLSPATGRPRA